MLKTLAERLDNVIRIPFSGCWIWMGGTHKSSGYGRLVVCDENGKIWGELAHRASYFHHYGIIPEGKHVLHDCDVPLCINPYHLHLGDQQLNMQEKKERKRGRGKSRFGADNQFFGKKHTDETKAKMSAYWANRRKS